MFTSAGNGLYVNSAPSSQDKLKNAAKRTPSSYQSNNQNSTTPSSPKSKQSVAQSPSKSKVSPSNPASYALPPEIWQKWIDPRYDHLKQAVLSFGGNTMTEAIIAYFTEVSLIYQQQDIQEMIKGTFYLTTNRIVFLPKNQIPHPNLVHATFTNLRCLTGVKNELLISISDNSSATANFKFPAVRTLYKCFYLLRQLADAMRDNEQEYQKQIYQIATTPPKETPFVSIEYDLNEVQNQNTLSIQAPDQEEIATEEIPDEPRANPIIENLTSLKEFMEAVNRIHFDIHIKLRILFFLSLFAFLVKFIPFLPLICLMTVIAQLYFAFLSSKKDRPDDDQIVENPVKQWEGHQLEGYVKTRQFFKDWFMFDNPRKSMSLMQYCFLIFITWLILPTWLYYLFSFCGFVYLIYRSVRREVIERLVSGYWFSS